MLGIQSSLPVTNSVKFGQNPYIDDSDYSDYSEVSDYETPDRFSKEAINKERDEKLKDFNETKYVFDDVADNLDKNPDKFSKGASKLLRFASAVVGLGVTFVTAKYGSRASIGMFKELANSNMGKKVVKYGSSLASFVSKKGGTLINALKDSSIVTGFMKSNIGKKITQILDKSLAKDAISFVKGNSKEMFNKVKAVNFRSVIENTMGASAATAVLVDDIAGRNDDKSNKDLFLGASGGDQ